MNKENDEILLHDYFDNILSEAAQKEFEEYLIDNIDLAIALGKLKNLERTVKNLSSNFTPSETVIENIIQSLLENKENVKIVNDETVEINLTKEKEKTQEKEKEEISKKIEETEETDFTNSIDEPVESDENIILPEDKDIKKSKDVKKEKIKIRPKTKYKLKKVFSGLVIISFLLVLVSGYYFYIEANSTTPWEINLISTDNSQSLQDIASSGLEINSILKTSDAEKLEIIIENNGKIKLSSNSKIEVITATKSLNSIMYYSGEMNFTPELNNEIFSILYNNFNIESTNSELSVSENKGSIHVNVKTNFITLHNGANKCNIPENHEFDILNRSIISIPINNNSSRNFIKLIDSYSLSSDDYLLNQIIDSATNKEVFTLYFLLPNVTPAYRELIIEKLESYLPIPSSSSKEDILILDQSSLDNWWEEFYFMKK